jgi:hypothetical protein
MKYFIEEECGGRDAIGGGCGAPLDFYEVEESAWYSHNGRKSDRPRSFNIRELPMSAFDEEGELVDMLISFSLKPCQCCWKS